MFWTRGVWDVSGKLDEELFYVMDYDLWMRMRLHTRNLLLVDDVYSYERTHRAQKTHFSSQADVDRNDKQKAQVISKLTRIRRQPLWSWLLISYCRRCTRAASMRTAALLHFSRLQRAIWRLMLARHG